MSLGRLAFYCAVIGGWSAFFAWMVCEFLFLRSGGDAKWQMVVCSTAIVGGAIGAGLNAVAGMSNGGVFQSILRLGPGFVGGGIGGAVGGLLGNLLFAVFGIPRVIGWIIMGLGIGVVEGLYERSPSKIRNGLIGGGLGGLAGGVLFDVLPSMIQSGSGMSSRATGFVILGLCIGAMIGLVQVALRDAWLTVVDGYRVGRQLILSSPVTVLGRGDHLRLPFVGGSNADLESEHLSIERRPTGIFFLRDLSSRLGSFVNNVPVRGEVDLNDGDTIKLGVNLVRFNLRHRRAGSEQNPTQPQIRPAATVLPPPPPVRQAAPPPPPPIRAIPHGQVSSPVPASGGTSTGGSPSVAIPATSATAAGPIARNEPPTKPTLPPPAARPTLTSPPPPVPSPTRPVPTPPAAGAQPAGFKLPPPPPIKKN